MKADDKRRKNLKRGGSGGRPKGCLNKITRDVRELATQIVTDEAYRKALVRRIKRGKAPHMETMLWHYAYGKPKETVEHSGRVDGINPVLNVIIESGPSPASGPQATS